MTIHEKRTKELFKLLIMAMCLLLSIFILMVCSNNTKKNNKDTSENKGQDQTVETNKLTKIAFEKNNNVYFYDEIEGTIITLGDNSKSKDLLELSPDKTKLVFRAFDEGKAIYPPHIIVYDIKSRKSTDIVISNKYVQQVIELKWLDNVNILVTGHINPSASGYSVYNVKSRTELLSCVGTIRDVSINKKNILYSNTPHVFPQLKANLYINGNEIFETKNIKEEIFEGVLSKDGKMIAFTSGVPNENNLNGENIEYLNLAKISSDGKSISDLKKISIGSYTTGTIIFDDENNISIISDEYIYRVKEGVLIKGVNDLPKETELSSLQLNKFKQTLQKKFPEDSITETTTFDDIDIYNMVTF
ncbi:MAG: hypothetical protein ACI8WT_002623 [Clostridium sp.]|jgi:hypothetical protein